MAKRHGVYDSDTHFLINATTRTMRNEGYAKAGLIQNDHNSERFTFEIPKTIEGHDMTKCDVVQVHYDNVGSKGIYEVEDMQISPEDPDVVVFSWLISGNATKNVGTLDFSVRFMCLGENGEIEYAWNTATYSNINVSKGVYNTESVMEESFDVLEQWKDELLENLVVQDGSGDGSLIANSSKNRADGKFGAAFGHYTKADGYASFADGYGSQAGDGETSPSYYSHADEDNVLEGYFTHAEGNGTWAKGVGSHAEGFNTRAFSQYTHAEGYETSANGRYSHVEGRETKTVSGALCAHAEGYKTGASGRYAHAEGYLSKAIGKASHASGIGSEAREEAQTVIGKYNTDSADALFIVGNGADEDNRSNAFEVISDRYGCAIKVGDTKLTEDDIIALQADICFQEGTTILMADGTYKAIQDVQYGDMIMTYDIDNNELVPCKSFGCLPTGFAHSWNHYCFDNGSVLKIFGGHRVYNADKQALVYFSKLEIGDHCVASNCKQTTYCYSPTKVPAAVSVRKYTIFCETGLYFANDILCGHPICQPLDFHIRTHGAVKLTDEDKAVIQTYADARDNEYLVEMQNKEYIAEALPIWKEQQTASRKIAECKEKLAKRDYKTIKAMQGKLTEDELSENIIACDELRTTINHEELVVANFKVKIKELQEKHNVHPRPLQTIETLNVKTAIAKARQKYID